MTKIKLCGLTRRGDIEAANRLCPEYIGFVFFQRSKRYISPQQAAELKSLLNPGIKAVGVFVDERVETVADLLESGVIDLAQLHGSEDEAYIDRLRSLTDRPIIKAFIVHDEADVTRAEKSSADWILLDSGMGSGVTFDQTLLKSLRRPYFLAGGLHPDNIVRAIRTLHPYAVDVSSGVETGGVKDIAKMTAFVNAVRKEDEL